MDASSTPHTRSREVVRRLSALEDPEERMLYIISRGKKAPGLEDELKVPKYKIEGCASDLWLVPELRDGRVYYRTDANAFITKGVASLLVDVYSGGTPEQILALSEEFLREAGVTQHLSMNRANGLAQVAKQIRLYAAAYAQLAGADAKK